MFSPHFYPVKSGRWSILGKFASCAVIPSNEQPQAGGPYVLDAQKEFLYHPFEQNDPFFLG